jgi:hypothetical protein
MVLWQMLLKESNNKGANMVQPNRIPDATARAVLVVEDDDALRESICSLCDWRKSLRTARPTGWRRWISSPGTEARF